MQAFWEQQMRNCEFDAEHLLILQAACEQFDLAQDCRAQIRKDGLMLSGKAKGAKKTRHPLLGTESKATELFARLIDKLIPEVTDAQTK
jgi:phage terminase small subunit